LSEEQKRERMRADRAGLRDGFYVNLGIGMPTLVANYVPEGMDVISAVGERDAGVGPYPREAEIDPDLIICGER